MIPRWLLPNGSDICALIRMSLGLNARTISHTPWRDSVDAERYRMTPERIRILAINARKGREARARRAQQQETLR